MSRVKGGVTANKRRKNILAETKGARFSISKKKRAAREAIYHANLHAFAHRKDKKNDFRRLWITRLNAALKSHGLRYNAFIKTLKDKSILLDRKVLSEIAKTRPEAFERFVKKLG
jgi:large subunit ribosomal protein L20